MRPEFASRLWNFSDNEYETLKGHPLSPNFQPPTHSKQKNPWLFVLRGTEKKVRFGDEERWDLETILAISINPLNASVALMWKQSIDLHSKSVDWFLYEGNTDI